MYWKCWLSAILVLQILTSMVRDPVLYRSMITTNKYINVMQTFPIVEKLNSEKVRKMRNLNNVYP